jgi:UbiD family decarboxylase
MPEFPGYTGPASSQCWLIKVKAVTHRENPIMQTCIGPSEEHVSMAGIPTEASIYGMVEKAMPGRLQNVYCGSAGFFSIFLLIFAILTRRIRSYSLRNEKPAMKEDKDRQHFLHFQHSVN